MPVLAVLVAIAFGGIYWRTGDTDDEPPAAEVAGATVVGSVGDLTGRPIANARVTIDGIATTATTDTHGRFHIPAVPPGTHLVRVTAPNYATDEQPTEIPPNTPQVEVTFRLRLDL